MDRAAFKANAPLTPATGLPAPGRTVGPASPAAPRHMGLNDALLAYARPRSRRAAALSQAAVRAELAAIRAAVEASPALPGARSFLLSVAREQALRGMFARGAAACARAKAS